MKLYYNQQQQRYEVSELGKLIDSDSASADLSVRDMATLMNRNGWTVDDDLPTEFSGDDQLSDQQIEALFQQLGEVA